MNNTLGDAGDQSEIALFTPFSTHPLLQLLGRRRYVYTHTRALLSAATSRPPPHPGTSASARDISFC